MNKERKYSKILMKIQFDSIFKKYILYIMKATTKTTTSIKLDKNIKEDASKLAAELGLSLSSVINATLKKFVDERRVVFSLAPKLNKKTEAEFLKIHKEIKEGKNLSKKYYDVEELFKDLNI